MKILLPGELIEVMKKTPQNPKFHGEGNVYNHTMLVVEAIENYLKTQQMSESEQMIFKTAALLHDVGKPDVTVLRNGNWSARGHEAAGVSIAREILLAYPEVSQEDRTKILDLVRWHHIPLRWITGEITYNQLLALSTQVNLTQMAHFSFADFGGRICEDRDWLLQKTHTFLHEIIPQIEKESLSFHQKQEAFSTLAPKHKNAVWTAYKLGQPNIWEKLLVRKPLFHLEKPSFKVIMTVGTPRCGKTTYLKQHYPDALALSLAQWELDEPLADDIFVRQRRISAFKYHLSAYSRQFPLIVLEGNNLHTDTRQTIGEIVRELNGELNYLFFEVSLQKSLAFNQQMPEMLVEESIKQAYKQLQYPHNWEAHHVIFAQNVN